jgi:signal transduction histidine kinase
MFQFRPIPFALVAPATIIFFGVAVTLVSTLFGLKELSDHAGDSATFQARVLVRSLAPRLATTSEEDRGELVASSAQISGCILLVVDEIGTVLHAAPNQPLSQKALTSLANSKGKLSIHDREHRYQSEDLPDSKARLYALAPVPQIAARRSSLISSMATFALVLLAAAGFVGWAMARDVHSDVLYVRNTIFAMAKASGRTHVEAIPVRTIDQVGQLTAAFNMLLERFRAAERAYRQDLSQARSFEEDRSAFLAALSHELRTPLHAILGFTDVLLDELDGPLSEELRENLTIVRTSGEHLRSLIDDILTLSALESGEFSLSQEQVCVATVAREVVTEARVTAAQKGIEISLSASDNDEETVAHVDRRRVRQILGNVVGNAVKFTNTGAVSVKVFAEDDSVFVEVQDTGPGIPEEHLESIFEEFRQADATNAPRVGTGLGLSISRRLLQMHGGSIHVKSTVGEGSLFKIQVPISAQPPARSPAKIPTHQDPVIYEV